MTWVAIALGGAIGSVARHAANHLLQSGTRFPFAITFVDISGCFVIGLLAGLLASDRIAMSQHWREFVFVGLLGGYTTFSTFGLDTFVVVRSGATGFAALNVGAQVVGGLTAVWVGYQFGVAKV